MELQLRESQLRDELQSENSSLREEPKKYQGSQELRAELQLRETQLRDELQSEEVENSRLREEPRKCQELLQEGVRKVRCSTVHIKL